MEPIQQERSQRFQSKIEKYFVIQDIILADQEPFKLVWFHINQFAN